MTENRYTKMVSLRVPWDLLEKLKERQRVLNEGVYHRYTLSRVILWILEDYFKH